jgi:hypothetical protein
MKKKKKASLPQDASFETGIKAMLSAPPKAPKKRKRR